MVNSRYSRSLKDLKGVAKKIAEDGLYKRNPPFLQAQMKYTIKEEDVVKNPPFVEGDRVQVINGPDAGKVAKIHAIYKDGNCAFLEGIGGTTKLVLPKSMWLEGQTKPVANVPNPIPYDNLRVVSQMKNSDGTVEDVAIHSVSFRGSYYDEDRNKIMPIRRAKHDPSIIVPYPVPSEPVSESLHDTATVKEVATERTFFPDTIVKSPIAAAAMDQIRNPYSKWNKLKKARQITADEVELYTAPKMPVSPATRQLFDQLQQAPKRKQVKFTKDIRGFINSEVEKGLNSRVEQEAEALKSYN